MCEAKTLWACRALLLVSLLLSRAVAAGEDSDPQALALLHKSEELFRSSFTETVYSMHIVRPDWERRMRFRSHDDFANNRFRMEILEPKKSRGTVFLKIGNKLSMYLPKLRRQIVISPAMMHDPWMGSDFNNQDLIESASLIEDYRHRIVARQGQGDAAQYTIESRPKPDAAVSWWQLVQKIRGDGIPLLVEYFRRENLVDRRLRFDDIGEIGGRRLPRRWVMQPADKPGEYTEIRLEQIHFDVPLDPTLFEPPVHRE